MQNDVPEQKNVTFAMEYQMKSKSIRWNRKKCIKFFCLDGRISESVVFPEYVALKLAMFPGIITMVDVAQKRSNSRFTWTSSCLSIQFYKKRYKYNFAISKWPINGIESMFIDDKSFYSVIYLLFDWITFPGSCSKGFVKLNVVLFGAFV